MKCPMIIKEAMKVIHDRLIASTPESAKKLNLRESGMSDVVIYKPFLRKAKGKAYKKYDNLIREYFLGLSKDELKQFEKIKSPKEKAELVEILAKEKRYLGRTTLQSRKPLIFGRKKYEQAVKNPHMHVTVFNKDKLDLKKLMQTSRRGFGRFKNPIEAYKFYNRTGWKTGNEQCPMIIKEAVYAVNMERKRFLRKPIKRTLLEDTPSGISKGISAYQKRKFKVVPSKMSGKHIHHYKGMNTEDYLKGLKIKEAAIPAILKGTKLLGKALWKARPKTIGQVVSKGLGISLAHSTAKGTIKAPKILKMPGITRI